MRAIREKRSNRRFLQASPSPAGFAGDLSQRERNFRRRKNVTKRQPKGRGVFEAMGSTNVDDLVGSKYKKDPSKANGSSIAVLAEYGGKRVLLAGDAHAEPILKSIKKINQATGNKRLHLDAFKLSHHGSKNNLTKSLLKKISCKNFLISTNGDKFGHPDNEAIARIVKLMPEKKLIFNYGHQDSMWNEQELIDDNNYEIIYPIEPNGGNSISFSINN